MIDSLYSKEILRKTTELCHVGRLDRPQGQADRVAKLCGSTIHIELSLQGTKISEFAQEIEACALGQACAAIVSQSIIGADISEVLAAREGLRALLKGEAATFPLRFEGLSLLASVKDYPQRHASTLLALEATVAAIEAAVKTPKSA